MDNFYPDFLSKTFLFQNMDSEEIKSIVSSAKYFVSDFSRDDIIYSSESNEKILGFIIDGSCEVMRLRNDADAISLNTLSKNAAFGILSFLTEEEYPTQIVAKRKTTVLFFRGNDILSIISQNPKVGMNVIKFLGERISFLNKRIATFSEKSTLQRLASYLLAQYEKHGYEFSVSRTKISTEINVGRASLYRDLTLLENEKIIKSEQKKIIIICPEGLERKIK